MDVLLINSPLFDSKKDNFYYNEPPPLGLGYIATSLKNHGLEVQLIDAIADGLSPEQIVEYINDLNPANIGINVFSTNLHLVKKIVTSPLTPRIFIGGPAADKLAPIVLDWESDNNITLIAGESELVMPAILLNKAQLVPWQKSKNRKHIHVKPDCNWFPSNIDLPLDRGFFTHEPIFENRWGFYESHIITSRGCGHDCAFCSSARSVNPHQKIRFRSIASIENEIRELIDNNPALSSIRILDDLFLRNQKMISKAAQLFRPHELRWRAMAHISSFHRTDTIKFQELAKSGCHELFIGVESGSNSMRRIIGKTTTLEATRTTIHRLLDEGINVKAYFILGFPDETEKEIKETYEFAASIMDYSSRTPGIFRVSVFKFRPYHGTQLYQDLLKKNFLPRLLQEDHNVAALSGQTYYDFTSDNFSAVPTEKLDKLTITMRELNR